jgi:hypothetical protein
VPSFPAGPVALVPVETPSIVQTPSTISTTGVSPSLPSALILVTSPLIFQYCSSSILTISTVGVVPSSAEI